ncbi:hypothetical protein BCR35DRAFT_356197 [Leucosporidium creatinivorum]|uniref:Zn(2)-C6 fungal-type domain-containing protein n=1 Tax=Leucosporidium creatinivorum TaxID=106004 RepID=A0A1Y2CKN1_9BASI|nr:hypothetical protein BCR35DRAFT_356197 [Leucosporidium creatinivorum]
MPPARAFNWQAAVNPMNVGSRAVSCENCRRRKMKCSRTFPCASCDMRDEECIWKEGTAPAPAGDTELEAAHNEVRRLRKLVDMLMGRLQEVQDDHSRLVDGFGLPPLPPSHIPFPSPGPQHRHGYSSLHQHHPHHSNHYHPYPTPSPALLYGGPSGSFYPAPPSSSSGASSIFDHRSNSDDSMSTISSMDRGYSGEESLFPGFPSGLPFAPPGVGSGGQLSSSSYINPSSLTAASSGAQPGDIFVSDGSEFLNPKVY